MGLDFFKRPVNTFLCFALLALSEAAKSVLELILVSDRVMIIKVPLILPAFAFKFLQDHYRNLVGLSNHFFNG